MKDLLTTRPRLASALKAAGEAVELTANPFHDKRPAWCYDATPEALRITVEFYQSIGKPLPWPVKKLMEGGEKI